MAITLKRPAEIEKMRAANKIVAQTLDHVSTIIKPGISLLEIDKICEELNCDFSDVIEHVADVNTERGNKI